MLCLNLTFLFLFIGIGGTMGFMHLKNLGTSLCTTQGSSGVKGWVVEPTDKPEDPPPVTHLNQVGPTLRSLSSRELSDIAKPTR